MSYLVIVESPTKARTLSRFLGSDYQIEATMGHVRDLPEKKLGIEIEEIEREALSVKHEGTDDAHTNEVQKEYHFVPKYEGIKSRKTRIVQLKKLAKEASSIILATDPDREGEAIAWHVSELLKLKTQNAKLKNKEKLVENELTTNNLQPTTIQRIVFHEITKSAIEEALKNPHGIDTQLVDAQQARRVLDRLVGYKLSPLLWNKLGKRWLSAGRVQSVALRLIVEREREIAAFVPIEYWLVEAELQKKQNSVVGNQQSAPIESGSVVNNQPRLNRGQLSAISSNQTTDNSFIARLTHIGDVKAEVKDKETAGRIVVDLEHATYSVSKVETKETRRYAAPPFTTSTLQQAASNRFGWSAKRTMQSAQKLYEEGYITYHRTDSTNIAAEAITMARTFIEAEYGKAYLPEVPKLYKTKSKVAQEAHEAIRPTRVDSDTIEKMVLSELGREAYRLYELIRNRFVSCQMNEAVFDQTAVDIEALSVKREASSEDNRYVLRANGQVMKFDGWMKVYEGELKTQNSKLKTATQNSKLDEDSVKDIVDSKQEKDQRKLPKLTEGEALNLLKLLPQQKFTEPPARYNEASLIKMLEEKGIGRPSTYAPIISTIQERKYVEKLDRRFHPTDLGVVVCDFLVGNFPDVFDISFTARMEDELDDVANGVMKWEAVVGRFYGPFSQRLDTVFKDADRVKVNLGVTDEMCPQCGNQLAYRLSKFGKFLACSKFPECKFTKSIVEKAGIPCPTCGGDIVVKKTRRGKQFYGCSNYPTCTFAAWKKEDIVKNNQ